MMPAPTLREAFWQAWLVAVVFVYPIPHTIALRNLLLLAGLVALLATWRGAARPRLAAAMLPAAWALAATTAWLVLHSLAVAPAPTLALDNLRGDWIVPLLVAALAAAAGARIEPRRALRAVIAALLAHMLWMFAWQAWQLATTGAVGDGSKGLVPFGERDFHSTLNGFLLALLLAERLAARPGASILAPRPGWIALGLALVADLALRVRNGTLVSLCLLLLSTTLMVGRRPRFVLPLLAVVALGGVSLTLDARWSRFAESAQIGWTSSSRYWLDLEPTSQPTTPSGAFLDDSAYLRVAWARQALATLAEQPLGIGFGRDAFGRAIEQRHGHRGMISSHSGWLDFALGSGLPGLVLLLATGGLAIRGGWRQYRRHDDAAGLMLSLLASGYLLRCLLDGHLSGWRLGLFALLCGVLIAGMGRSPTKP